VPYPESGPPSIAPEYLLRALLLQIIFFVRSKQLLVEQIDYNLLFRWLAGLGMDDAVWNHAMFSKNRDQLLNSEVAQHSFAEVKPAGEEVLRDEHFTVGGALIQAWASQKSFRPKDGSGGDRTNFHGQKRSNRTSVHNRSRCAALQEELPQGIETELCGPCADGEENRNGPIAAAMVTRADGHEALGVALLMLRRLQEKRRRWARIRLYDSMDIVHTTRELNVTPHGAVNEWSSPDPRTSRQPGYAFNLQPPLADRKELCMAEADRTIVTAETAKTGQGRLLVG
jgi:transposase